MHVSVPNILHATSVRRGLQNGSSKYPAGAQDWPLVLWKDEKVDLENLPDGFLRNQRLIKVRRSSQTARAVG